MPAQLRKISPTPKRLQSENGLFFIEDISIIVYSANYYSTGNYYRHLIVSYGSEGNKLFVLYLYGTEVRRLRVSQTK